MRISIRCLVALTLGCFFLVADAQGDNNHKWGKVTPEQWATTVPPEFPEAAAAVIFDLGSLEVEQPYKGNVTTFKRHVRSKVFSKAGADLAISIEIPTYGRDDLRNFEAMTILPGDQKVKLSKKDVFTKKVGKNREVFTFTFPAVEDGCIVEYKYDIISEDFGFLEPWYFQGPLYTYESEFTALIHQGLNYTAVTHNVPAEFRSPVREEMDLQGVLPVKFTWRLANIFPVESEPYMAAINSYRASLFFQLVSYKDAYNNIQFIKDWPTLAEVVEDEYLTPALDHHSGVKETMQQQVADLADPLAKIVKLYDFIRLEILTIDDFDRYVLAPREIDKILADRRGTSVGKNLLLIRMLRDAGITANPLLIGTRSYSLFNAGVHDLGQFNHMICLVTIGDDVYVMDAGERWVPFPYLPPEDLVSGGLLIDGKNSQPVIITAPNRSSGFVTTTRMLLQPDGSAICSTHVMIMGHLLSQYKELLVSQPTSDDVKETLIDDDESSFELIDYSFTEIPGEDSVGIDMTFRLNQYCDIVDNNLAGEPLMFSIKSNPFSKKNRFFPVDFAYPFYVSENVELVLADSLSLRSMPENVNATINGLRYSRITLQSGNQARVMSQMIVEKSLFIPNEYAALRETYDKIAHAGTDRFVVGRSE